MHRLSNITRTLRHYIADHWRGRHSLVLSFWVNFVLLRAAIFAGQAGIVPGEGEDFSELSLPVLGAAVVAHGIVFVWQVVGVLRSAENYIRASGFMAPFWGVLVSAVLGFFLTAASVLEAFQMTIPVPREENFAERMDREHASKYTISQADDPGTIVVSGDIELGITRNLTAYLADRPRTRRLILESGGGNVYEARGVSKLVRDRKIDTHVDAQCLSACTLIFMSGHNRTIRDGAKLGFHQYRIDTDIVIPGVDPGAEQRTDQSIFERSGVSEWFRKRMFDSPHDQMWYPSQSVLLRARVVHSIVRRHGAVPPETETGG